MHYSNDMEQYHYCYKECQRESIAQKIEAYVLQEDISDYNISSEHIKGPAKETPYNSIQYDTRVSVEEQKSDNSML